MKKKQNNTQDRDSLWTSPLNLLKSGYQLGVVLSESSIRLALLRRTIRSSRVLNIRNYPLNSTEIETWPGRISHLVTLLNEYITEHQLKSCPVNISLLSHDIGFRRTGLPDMPEAELESAVAFQCNKLFPFDVQDCAIHYDVVDAYKQLESDYLRINIIAAKNEIINELYDQFKVAGLKLGQVNYMPGCLARLSEFKSEHSADSRDLIIYLDDEQSMAVFAHNGHLEFHQEFVIQPTVDESNPNVPVDCDALIDELVSFLDLYNADGQSRTIDSMILCGKYAFSKETAELFNRATSIPCLSLIDLDRFTARVGDFDTADANTQAPAIITALAKPHTQPLAPPGYLKARARSTMIRTAAVAAVVALLAISILQYINHEIEQELGSRLSIKYGEINEIESSVGYRTYLKLLGKLHKSKAYLAETQSARATHVNVLLKELSLTVPNHLNLTTINLDRGEKAYVLTLGGEIRLEGFSPEIILAQYVEKLEHSPFFTNVEVATHFKQGGNDEFELTFQLRMEARV